MQTEQHTHNIQHKTSFFQDSQRLTFALGLSSGLAVMAIVGFIIIAVKSGSGSGNVTAYKKATNSAATNTNANPADAAQYDPIAIATSIGIDQNKMQSCLTSKKYEALVNKSESDASAVGVSGTPTTFVNGTEVSGAQDYSVLKAAIDAALNGTKGTVNVPAVSKDDHVLGGKNPKVYLIEYSDFQCTYCKRFGPTIKQALDEYGDKIALVYRHFPLNSIHPYAQSLAEGSECANEIGGKDKFWQFHDKIFEG
jgi:protein-disulfide isomerase